MAGAGVRPSDTYAEPAVSLHGHFLVKLCKLFRKKIRRRIKRQRKNAQIRIAAMIIQKKGNA